MQPAGVVHHPRTFMGMLGGIPPIQIYELVSIFKSKGYNYMAVETLKEFSLASAEADYENSG